MVQDKKFKRGFTLCMVGASLLLAAVLTYLILIRFDRLTHVFLPLEIGISVIILSVYGKKGGRKEIIGALVLSCLSLSILSLIGSVLMLKHFPAAEPASAENADEAQADEAPQIAQTSAAESSESEQASESAGSAEEITAVKKQNETIIKCKEVLGKVGARFRAIRARFRKEHASKKPAFVFLTCFFAAVLIARVALLFLGDFPHRTLILLPFALLSLPTYLVYLGAHNPLNFPKGYAVLFIVLGGIGFFRTDLPIRSFIAEASMYFTEYIESNGILYGYLIYHLLASVICAQIATLFIFPYFVNEETASKAAIGVVVGCAFLLPLVFAIIIYAILAVVGLVLLAVLAVFILGLVAVLLKYSNYGNSGASQSGDKVVVNDGGQNIELTYLPNAVGKDRYERVYEDYAGRRYASSDGGKTFHRM